MLTAGIAVANDSIIRHDNRLDAIIARDTQVQTLASGFTWSEGPAWDTDRHRLYFSDVPENKAYTWSEKDGIAVFLAPSGLQSAQDGFREPGSNGLLVKSGDQLLIANHGERAIEAFDLSTGVRSPLASRYAGRRFNSPNDLVVAEDGTIYFTDPPYGLDGLNGSPLKEISFNGLYAVSPSGDVRVVDKTLTFPNGVALSPDGLMLYVAVSDPAKPVVYRYRRRENGVFGAREVWFDASTFVQEGLPGLPDGLAVAKTGEVFAAGPGGVFVLNPNGDLLGQIRLPKATANCTFGEDGKTLFITSSDRLLSVRILVNGIGYDD